MAQNFIDAFEETNKYLSDAHVLSAFIGTYRRRPSKRCPHFADVIAALWHDLPEEKGSYFLRTLEADYLRFIEENLSESSRGIFYRATGRIIAGIQDLTREESNYLFAVEGMIQTGKRKHQMHKASDGIANIGEMDDLQGTLVGGYNRLKERVFRVAGFDTRLTRLLRDGKNRLVLAAKNLDRRLGHVFDTSRIKSPTFTSVDKIKAVFQGFAIIDGMRWYLHRANDPDPYLIQLNDRLIDVVLERGYGVEFHLLNYYCRGHNIPPHVNHNNWRLFRHLQGNGQRELKYAPGFLQPYLGDNPKPFDLQGKKYIDSQVQQAVVDRTLFRITESKRGGALDGLVERYLSRLAEPESSIDRERATQEVTGNRTLQYMLTAVLLRIVEQYRADPHFRFNWGDARVAAAVDNYTRMLRNARAATPKPI